MTIYEIALESFLSFNPKESKVLEINTTLPDSIIEEAFKETFDSCARVKKASNLEEAKEADVIIYTGNKKDFKAQGLIVRKSSTGIKEKTEQKEIIRLAKNFLLRKNSFPRLLEEVVRQPEAILEVVNKSLLDNEDFETFLAKKELQEKPFIAQYLGVSIKIDREFDIKRSASIILASEILEKTAEIDYSHLTPETKKMSSAQLLKIYKKFHLFRAEVSKTEELDVLFSSKSFKKEFSEFEKIFKAFKEFKNKLDSIDNKRRAKEASEIIEVLPSLEKSLTKFAPYSFVTAFSVTSTLSKALKRFLSIESDSVEKALEDSIENFKFNKEANIRKKKKKAASK